MTKNLVDEVWTERPKRPNNPVIVLSNEYTGKEFSQKIEDVRKELEKRKSPGFVVSMLDEIAWLYNLRGSEYVFTSRSVVPSMRVRSEREYSIWKLCQSPQRGN